PPALPRTLLHPLSLHDALPISAYSLLAEDEKEDSHRRAAEWLEKNGDSDPLAVAVHFSLGGEPDRAKRHYLAAAEQALAGDDLEDRKSTRLNSSHVKISYAVFC